jgi:hypothetical protein
MLRKTSGNKKTSKNVCNSKLIIVLISTFRRTGKFQNENLVHHDDRAFAWSRKATSTPKRPHLRVV